MTRPAYLVQNEVSDTPLFGPSRKVKRERTKLPPHAPDSDTSKAAAEYIAPHVERMEVLVLDAIKEYCALGHNGATSFDVSRWTGIDHDSIAPRFSNLKTKGLIQKTERRLAHPDKPESTTRAWAWELITS